MSITTLVGNNRVYRWYRCWLVITYQERGLLIPPPPWRTGPPSVRRMRSNIWPLPHGGWAGGWARCFHSLHSHIWTFLTQGLLFFDHSNMLSIVRSHLRYWASPKFVKFNSSRSYSRFRLDLSRILESLMKVGCPSRFKSFLSDL